jgi:hypothetical protein
MDLSELEKFCPTSAKRFPGPLSVSATALSISVVGSAGEEVSVTAITPAGKMAVRSVRLVADGVPQQVRFAAARPLKLDDEITAAERAQPTRQIVPRCIQE